MRNPDLACYSDTMLVDALLDALAAGSPRAGALATEVGARGLIALAQLRAPAWSAPRPPGRR